jgi:hypothetical protein
MKFKLKVMLTWSLFVLFTLFAIVLIFPSLESLCTSSIWVTKVNIPAGQVITTNLLVKVDFTTNTIYGSV